MVPLARARPSCARYACTRAVGPFGLDERVMADGRGGTRARAAEWMPWEARKPSLMTPVMGASLLGS